MALDAAAVGRIRTSFELVAPRGAELIEAFYERLFATAPAVRGMFPEDMTTQKKHLLAAVGLVVKHADGLGAIEGPLMEMGARHVKYGAVPAHYGVVRDTLLATLGEMAGAAWTEQVKADWTAALNAVAGTMLKGADATA